MIKTFSRLSPTPQRRCLVRKTLCAAIGSLVLTGAGQVMAAGGMLEEIVVTAQKRAQNMQDVPIAITAFSQAMIEKTGATSLSDMENATPSMNFGSGARSTRGEINIRGVGGYSRNPGVDARASVYVDGVFVGRSAVFDQDLQDVTGIEVLRGPQGTLFGKNTITGAININTEKPHEEFSGRISAEVGNYDRSLLAVKANIPLIQDKLYSSFALTKLDRDGYIENITLDEDVGGIDRISGRAKLRFIASDRLEFNVGYDFLDESDNGFSGEGVLPGEGFGGFAEAPKPREVSHNLLEKEERDFWGVSLTADYDFGDDYTFTSISSYREAYWYNLNEEDYSSSTFGLSEFDEDNEQFTQELRINSPRGDKFDYLFGLYYIEQDIKTGRGGTVGGGDVKTPVGVETMGWAAYFNSNYRFSEQLEVSFGLRYTYDEKDIDFLIINPTGIGGFLDMTGQPSYQDSYDTSAVTPKFGLNYTFNDDVMIYASYAEGFKSGGHNVDFIQTLEELPFDEETAVSYEVGVKSTLFDGMARVNVAFFQTTFEDFQVQQFQELPGGISRISVSNASEAVSEGVEAELIVMPIEGLALTFSVASIDATFEEFKECANGVDCGGNRLPFSPELKTFLAADYEYDLNDGSELLFRLDYGYSDELYTHALNTPVREFVAGMETFNARIGFTSADGHWKAALWGKNLKDEDNIKSSGINFFGITRGVYNDPRTYGVSISYSI
jgi:iron complex outermembrane receptor protein